MTPEQNYLITTVFALFLLFALGFMHYDQSMKYESLQRTYSETINSQEYKYGMAYSAMIEDYSKQLNTKSDDIILDCENDPAKTINNSYALCFIRPKDLNMTAVVYANAVFTPVE